MDTDVGALGVSLGNKGPDGDRAVDVYDSAGRQAPEGDERARAEYAVLLCFLTVRTITLVQGGVNTATAWRSYRRPRLVLATLGLVAAESAWLAVRCLKRRAVDDPVVAVVDTVVGLAGLGALAAGTTVDDRTAWVNWMCPLTYNTAAVAAISLDRPAAAAATAALAGAYLVTTAPNLHAGGSQLSTAVSNTMSYPGFLVATDTFVRRLRRSATELEEARRTALERGQRLAAERERNRQHRLLHDSALQSLELISRGMLDPTAARNESTRAAATLRAALSGDPGGGTGGLRDRFEDIAVEFAQRGLTVELVIDAEGVTLNHEVSPSLVEATREALTNVAKHARVPRAVVHVSETDDAIEVTVRDHGVGFDPDSAPAGFGLLESIRARIDESGGTTTVWSQPQRGTRITLRVPR